MALTAEQKKARTRAQLELLIATALEARQAGNAAAMQQAKDRLADFNSPFEDLNRLARDTAAAIGVAELKRAADDYARIAHDLVPLAAVFRDACDAAEARERDLLLPHLAAFTAQTAQVLTSLKSGLDALRRDLQQAGQTDDLGDLADLAGSIIDRLKEIRSSVESLET